MSKFQRVPEGKDPILWDFAHRRASFKKHVFTYFVINAFLWAIWYFTNDATTTTSNTGANSYPWPIWTSIGWGLGLAIHFVGAYTSPKSNLTEKEYQKLKQQ